MKIKKSDITIYTKSAQIEKINKRKDVESLYFLLSDEMSIKGWQIDVVDYNYMNFLCIHFNDYVDARIVNNNDVKDGFIDDLVECVNNILN